MKIEPKVNGADIVMENETIVDTQLNSNNNNNADGSSMVNNQTENGVELAEHIDDKSFTPDNVTVTYNSFSFVAFSLSLSHFFLICFIFYTCVKVLDVSKSILQSSKQFTCVIVMQKTIPTFLFSRGVFTHFFFSFSLS